MFRGNRNRCAGRGVSVKGYGSGRSPVHTGEWIGLSPIKVAEWIGISTDENSSEGEEVIDSN